MWGERQKIELRGRIQKMKLENLFEGIVPEKVGVCLNRGMNTFHVDEHSKDFSQNIAPVSQVGGEFVRANLLFWELINYSGMVWWFRGRLLGR